MNQTAEEQLFQLRLDTKNFPQRLIDGLMRQANESQNYVYGNSHLMQYNVERIGMHVYIGVNLFKAINADKFCDDGAAV